MIRAFVAIPLPDDIRAALVALQARLQVGRVLPPENLHLTLVFLGEVPDPLLEEVHLALSGVHAAPLTLRLAGLDMFGGARPRSIHARVVPDPALDHLQARVAQAARTAGVQVEARRFVPHVTLAYVNAARTGRARLARAVAGGAAFAAGPFQVHGFALYRSDLGRGPARHAELAQYPLSASPNPSDPA
ncbi:RNA 2',3'-cyclic phosphodiesterase [Rhodovulum adriaticum]|uniref:RNA 2',3'-cyclic phosphodiesterase n=1 Tax=Rhodovulum adriaticum TaxID=35804 RepID=A0A4R2NMQ7_RHOAD|nr:RNA 2',3'-cyclic phosphodiesterase [Rhodovulum adriaticum]MBK1636372.1 RNA 2',3'-cyclic phosphodiesterase [Rhodovulum adriaticum]TCP22861.1 2'-5' RNA ligase [Rhodovulum adriaticum]